MTAILCDEWVDGWMDGWIKAMFDSSIGMTWYYMM